MTGSKPNKILPRSTRAFGVVKFGRRRKLTTTSLMLCTRPHFPRASGRSSPGPCTGPAPAVLHLRQVAANTLQFRRQMMVWGPGGDVLGMEKCTARPVAPRGCLSASSPPLGLTTNFPLYYASPAYSQRRVPMKSLVNQTSVEKKVSACHIVHTHDEAMRIIESWLHLYARFNVTEACAPLAAKTITQLNDSDITPTCAFLGENIVCQASRHPITEGIHRVASRECVR